MIKYHCRAMIFYCAKKARKIISSIIFVLMVFGLGTGVAFASLTGNDNQSFVKFVYKNIEKEILSDKFVNIKKYFTDASNQIPNLKEILAKDIKPIEIKKVFSFNNGGAMVAGVFNTVSGTIKNFIFTRNNQSDQGESDAVSPVYSYTREEVDKIVKNKTEEIRKEILNLKSQVQSSEGNKTIINQPVSERVVEKIIETKTQVSGISQNELEERLLNLNTSLLNRISQVESNANTQTTGVYRAVSLTNRINNLSNITVSGVTGLTDSDIPDTITASNYLPLSGGAVTGNLTVDTSTLVVDSANDRVGIGTTSPNWKLSVAGIGSFDDYVRASYFTATSTTATSSIAGVFSVGSTTPAANALFSVGTSSPLFFIDKQTGNIGVGTLGGSARRFEVLDVANPQLRLSQDSTTYTDFTVAPSTGDLTLSLYPSGSADDIILTMPGGSTGANLWVCEGTACPSANLTGGGNIFVEGSIKYATSTTPKTRRSIILTAAGAVTPTTSGAAKTQVDGTNSHSYYVLDFDASSDEAAYWQWTMPDSYDDGAIEVTYYWETAATTGNVVWCFQSVGIQADSNEDMEPDLSSWPSECATDGALASANDLSSVTEAATSSRFTAGEYVAFKVFRDADNGSDTINSNDARLVKVKIEYGVDQESD